MARLNTLRSQLSALKRSRASVRWSTAMAAVAIAVLWALIVIFLLDWSLSMSVPQRIFAMVVGVGAIIWAWRKYASPLLGKRESDMDMALMVERQQGIDSDLVAALQFEQPEASRWGSVQLEKAVVEYVADFSRGLNVWEGFSREQMVRRASVLAVTVLLVVAGAAIYSGHFMVFLSRLALSNKHYPTRTNIEEVRINGRPVDFYTDRIRAAYGQPVDFRVLISGELPQDVKKIELRSSTGAAAKPIELKQDKQAPADQPAFTGQLSQLVDNTTYQIYVGDGWTEPTTLEVIALPVVELKLTPTPPAYARGVATESEPHAGAHRLAVLPGARVDVEISCANKPLTSATLTVDNKQYPLAKQDDEGKVWKLTANDTPLARIEAKKGDEKRWDLPLQIQVVDEDGLSLPHPLEGHIHIREDRPPTILASIKGSSFLPDGTPRLSYTANDEFGIASVRVIVEPIHQTAGSSSDAAADAPATGTSATAAPAESALPPITLTKDKGPTLRGKLPLKGTYQLALEPYKLAKGDQARIIVEATNYRGDLAGATSRSEPIILQITDLSGVLAALSDTDRQAYEQMNQLIQRQSQTGGLK